MITSFSKKPRKPMKSRGMAGRTPSAAEKEWHSALASLGCIACKIDGIFNDYVSIHHVHGRTSPNAH